MVSLLMAALQFAGASLAPQPPPSAPPRASAAAVVDSARGATSQFNWLWRFYWEASVTQSISAAFTDRRPLPAGLGTVVPQSAIPPMAAFGYIDQIRRQYLHCHPDGFGGFRRIDVDIIESGAGKRAVCPSWDLSAEPPPFDERLGIDAEIRPELLPGLRLQRLALLALLDRAAAAVPDDDWIAGQRVRFALDQGDTTRALASAMDCRAQTGWCMALQAYVRYGRGQVPLADSIFQAAVVRLPGIERCEWTDLAVLLGSDGAKAYEKIPCHDRDSVNARIWWLTTPMYTESGNERRAEHYAREVDLKLRETDVPAQRWDMRDREGGQAVREMLIRYGWPAYSYWAGHYEDAGHFGYLGVFDSTTMAAGIFATAEYPLNRFHTVPSWTAIEDPWHAADSAWSLDIPLLPKTSVMDVTWWPQEHAVHAAGPLVQLSDVQSALLRRDSTIALAVATEPQPRLLRRPSGDTIAAALIVSSGPDSIRVQRARAVVGATAVMRTTIASAPEIVGVEYPQGGGRPSVRTRFGVVPPPTLREMAPHAVAISPPVLLRAPEAGATPETDPDRALDLMFGATTFSTMGRVGVYWETYGVGAGDTVDVAVHISPRLPPRGVLRRVVSRLGIGAPPPGGVSGGWREPSPGRLVTTIPGAHPIQARNVTLDLSRLAPGPYAIAVSVARPGEAPISATREFVILPP